MSSEEFASLEDNGMTITEHLESESIHLTLKVLTKDALELILNTELCKKYKSILITASSLPSDQQYRINNLTNMKINSRDNTDQITIILNGQFTSQESVRIKLYLTIYHGYNYSYISLQNSSEEN